jgi:hypothetical protein
MQTNKELNYWPIIVYVLLFIISLAVFSLHSIAGMHIPSYWGRGIDAMRIDTSMVNGVEITSYQCPMFFDENEGAEVSISIKNKDDRKQTAGVVFLISKLGQRYDQIQFEERMRLQAGEKRSFVWHVDRSNLVDDKVSLRLFLGQSPDHPAHSSRACLILPWRGPLPVTFMNSWAYPLLVLLFILSALWIYYKSGLDWENKKRLFFFLFASSIVVLMFLSLLIKFYTSVLIALPFLFLGIVATLQTSPYIPIDEYRKFIDLE